MMYVFLHLSLHVLFLFSLYTHVSLCTQSLFLLLTWCPDEFCLSVSERQVVKVYHAMNSFLPIFSRVRSRDRFILQYNKWLWVELLGHMCFYMLRTYVMILCNWLILWQNALYLYLGRLRMCLNTSRNYISRSSVEASKSVQEIKQKCKFIKARQLVDSFSTPPICRDLRISEFNSNFLRIRESVFGPSFLLTLDI